MNRREFIGGLGAAAGLEAFAGSREKPYLKVGFLTDTHVKQAEASCELVRGAFRIFKAQGVEAIGHCGDLADLHWDEAYRHYRAAVETTYPDPAARPKLLYVYANHDLFDGDGWDRNVRPSPPMMPFEKGFTMMREKVGIDHGWFHETELNGVPFLVFPESYGKVGGETFLREKIAAACAAHPKGPVVVMLHHPPADTVAFSDTGASEGDDTVRRVLDAFPQVICFNGHKHNSLWNEGCIWQGTFTSVNVGCLYEWHCSGVGVPFAAKRGYGVIVAEFYRDRLVLRRFDTRDGGEYKPLEPWTVLLPFVAAKAPYAPAAARKRERKVPYPAGAKISVAAVGTPFRSVRVTVPDSAREDLVLYHRLRIAVERKGQWQEFFLQERFSEFHLREKDRKGQVVFELSSGYFARPGRYRFTAVPVGFAGTEGTPIQTVWTAPEAVKTEMVWKSFDPVGEMKCPLGAARTPAAAEKLPEVPKEDGWWLLPDGGACHLQPPKSAWDVPKGTRLRFTVDLRLDQDPDVRGWKFSLAPCSGNWRHSPTGPVELPRGKVDFVRVVKDFTSVGPERDYWLEFNGRKGGRLRVLRIKVEKILEDS